jgi:hypothetical protein
MELVTLPWAVMHGVSYVAMGCGAWSYVAMGCGAWS